MSEWACGSCTYLNNYARSICELCEAPRPRNAAPAAPAPAPVPAPVPVAPAPAATKPATTTNTAKTAASKTASSPVPAGASSSSASSSSVSSLASRPVAAPAPAPVLTPAAQLAAAVEAELQASLRAKAREANAAAAAETRAEREAAELRRKTEALKREALVGADRAEHAAEARAREAAAWTAYPDIPAALGAVYRHHGITRLQLVCRTLLAIVTRIVREPANARFHRVSRRNDTILTAFVRSTGGLSLLRCCGFRPAADGAAFELAQSPPAPAALAALAETAARLQARLDRTVTPVRKLWPQTVDADPALTAPVAAPGAADAVPLGFLADAQRGGGAGSATAAAAGGGRAMTDNEEEEERQPDRRSGSGSGGAVSARFALASSDPPFVPSEAAVAAALATTTVTDPGTADEQAFVARELHRVVANALASCHSAGAGAGNGSGSNGGRSPVAAALSAADRELRCVVTDAPGYRRHLGRHPWALEILSKLGYTQQSQAAFPHQNQAASSASAASSSSSSLEVVSPDASLLEAAANELAHVGASLAPQCSVFKVTLFMLRECGVVAPSHHLGSVSAAAGRGVGGDLLPSSPTVFGGGGLGGAARGGSSAGVVTALLGLIQSKVVANLVATPDDPRFHRINVAKLIAAARRQAAEARGEDPDWAEAGLGLGLGSGDGDGDGGVGTAGRAAAVAAPRGLLSLLRALGYIVSADGTHAATPYGLGVVSLTINNNSGSGGVAAARFDVDLFAFKAEGIARAIKAGQEDWDM